MKKLAIFTGLSLLIFAACNSGDSGSTQDTTAALSQTSNENRSLVDTMGTNEPEPGTLGDQVKGKELISKSDCLTCHKEHEKLIGPAYADVAKKYENNAKNVDYLVGKIIAGGSGVWGEVPMTPHPGLSKDDAGEMVRYVLSLK